MNALDALKGVVTPGFRYFSNNFPKRNLCFIADCSASVNFVTVSGDVCCCTMIIHSFIYLFLLFRENSESLGCLGTLADKGPRCVLSAVMCTFG